MKRTKDEIKKGEHKIFNQCPAQGIKCDYKCVYWEGGGWCKVNKCNYKIKKRYKKDDIK
jgi:hypothetical protein